ncbi:MAG: GNAT family N-acetyltransferase [Actinomycetota bacterium]
MTSVREASRRDLRRATEVENDALGVFDEIGFGVFSSTTQWLKADGMLFAKAVGRPLKGFAVVILMDDHAHLEGLYVARKYSRQGLGSALLDAACNQTQELGLSRLTVSTYLEVAFNAPWYRQRGFSEVIPANMGENLARLVESEQAGHLVGDGLTRVVLERRFAWS